MAKKDPQKLVDDIASEENRADVEAVKRVLMSPINALKSRGAKTDGKTLAERAEEEGFNRMVKRDAAMNEKAGVPTNPSEAKFMRDVAYERARDAGNRARQDVERGERTDAMGNAAYKKGGSVKSSASKRADGIAQRGKTKGRIC